MRRLPVVVFVVDDKKEDAERCSTALEESLKTSASMFMVDDLRFELKVVALYPMGGELANDFEARFERILCLQDPETRPDSMRLQAILFDLAFELSAAQGASPTSGERLAEMARCWRPSATRYGLTSMPFPQADKTPHKLLKTPFKKEQLDTEASASRVAREILADLEKRFATPTWDGLIAFSKLPKVPMHAMAASEARQAELSFVVDPFLRLLGSTYYQIESTSTKYPLDSLLAPTGALKDTQDAVAASFGATKCHLVTNGTSTSNKIVYSALLREGDYVLVDECCHISHHMALAITGARAIYMAPQATGLPGIPGQVSAQSVADALETLLAAHPNKVLPKLIAITNCTFDGYLIDPATVFDAVLRVLIRHDLGNRLSEITFLFDEAWFSFGYFHPHYVTYSAMGATNRMKNGDAGGFWSEQLNVIATQSLHKTGFALRQASVVLRNFGNIAGKASSQTVDRRFQSAIKMFTTTSPSMPILASIDWARRQLDIEGCFLVEKAHDAVNLFRDLYDDLTAEGSIFYLDEGGEAAGPPQDRTKMTLRSSYLSGQSMRDALWSLESVKIQVNKFATDSVLMMFMPGFSDRSSGLLRTAMNELIEKDLPARLAKARRKQRSAPSLATATFLDANGEMARYPEALARSDGFEVRRGAFENPRGKVEIVALDKALLKRIRDGGMLYSLDYVTPYPPGFPVLLPGQFLSTDVLAYLLDLEHGEIHGLRSDQGIRSLAIVAIA